MPNKTGTYYYLEIDRKSKKILDWGETPYATLDGHTDDPGTYRIFLTKGQYNKFVRAIA